MADQLLWRRLTLTDFRAINGQAAPSGSGGGAVHIALNKPSAAFALDKFLRQPGKNQIARSTAAGPDYPASMLNFLSNPTRRRGEWIIQDQYRHRHPAWRASAGFPSAFDPQDEPFVLIFRVGSAFHVRWARRSQLRKVAKDLPSQLLSTSVGIGPVGAKGLAAFELGTMSLLDDFEEDPAAAGDAFNPRNLEDARKRVFRSIRLRQGRVQFRKRLLEAYGGACAFSGEGVQWVLDAAHIVPYLGTKTNHVTNGLLLRTDIHTLFDLGLVAVHPSTRTLRVAVRLKSTPYYDLRGEPLREAKPASQRASEAALQAHFSRFAG
jgi:hypothetical protein